MVEGGRLDAVIQLNVKGMSQFGSELTLSGNITAAADGTASYSCINHDFSMSVILYR